MSLSAGDRLGPFEITGLIGEGGMGQVYRARDAKLARDVAIKVLPDTFARDAERLARFRREAQALAALNDSHIAQIYTLEETGGRAALVMEFVDGKTIADMLHGRPLDTDDALRYGAEIAAGLETAHEKGIVHRDLKPANVKVTTEGRVKILDFGLAKAMGSGGADDAGLQLANSPTLTAQATAAGMILGTAAYMSPEQARGKALDKRTDIWAFGCVLFEMLTGRRTFQGETVSDTLASVLRSDPDWSALSATVPPHVRALLGRCLERDVTRRLRDIGEARLALSGVAPPATSTIQISASQISAPAIASRPARPWLWIAATLVLLAVLAAVLPTSSLVRRDAPVGSPASYEMAITAPRGAEFEVGSNSGNVILSPDGTRIAFVASTDKAATIWIRSLAADDARPVPGTEGASNPFWSPKGDSIGFFANGKIWAVKIAGGLPEVLGDAAGGRGGAWSEDGTIIFAVGGSALSRVSASGGAVTRLTKLDLSRGENAHYWPVFLPGGKKFLYFVRSTKVENGGIYVGQMDGSPSVRLVSSLSSGILARHPVTGRWYLMWVRDDDLLAQPFDVESLTLSGDVATIATGIRVEGSQRLAYVSASLTGQLAWATSRAADNVLAVYNRDGRRIRTLDVPQGKLVQPVLSPDGKRLLFTGIERGGADIFLYDLSTNVTERLTTDPSYEEAPAWTPDGSAMVYFGKDGEKDAVLRLAIGRGAQSEPLFTSDDISSGYETADRRFLILTLFNAGTGDDIVVRVRESGKLVPLVAGPGSDILAGMSTDGRTLLMTQQSGSRSFASVARLRTDGPELALGALQMVADGVRAAVLRPDGREVIVVSPDGLVKAIALAPSGDTIAIGATTPLFQAPRIAESFTVGPTGQEFVAAESPFALGQTLRVLTRWDVRLRK
jgi:serine/threonine protein kinase/Tol biopolymer transport system component